MSAKVFIKPSAEGFVCEPHESILNAALRAGLAVDYGCTNGSCGRCRAQLLGGETTALQHSDYTFTEAEKSQGYILTCSCSAKTDITLLARLATDTEDMPYQTLQARVKKYEMLSEEILYLRLRTPRTQSLRFFAGQQVLLEVHRDIAALQLPIASCPCDGMQLEFHLRRDASHPGLVYLFEQLSINDVITVSGPIGDFVFNEQDTRALFLFAYDTGFAAIRSLTEHVISRELSQPIQLFWLTPDFPPYAHNYCRSVSDAIDNIGYTTVQAERAYITETLEGELAAFQSQYHDIQIYAAAPAEVINLVRPTLLAYVSDTSAAHTNVTL